MSICFDDWVNCAEFVICGIMTSDSPHSENSDGITVSVPALSFHAWIS